MRKRAYCTVVSGKKQGRVFWSVIVGLVLALTMLVQTTPRAHAAPFSCGEQAWLFQYPDNPASATTDVTHVDLATGSTSPAFIIDDRRINAVGYNVLNDFIYGFDENEQALVRIETGGVLTELPAPPGLPLSAPGVASYRLGDIDADGHFWIARDQEEDWFEIDLEPGSPDFGEVVGSGSLTDPAGLNLESGADWAFVPGHTGLYRLVRDGDASVTQLVRFDTDTGVQTTLGSLGNLGDPSRPHNQRNNFGAVYSDSNGFLYGSENFSGNIYRIDIDAVEATFFAGGPSSILQDGVRCFTDPLNLDFGDAPDSYGTLLASSGPRHTQLSTLLLGSAWDAETDAPGLDGAGDDLDGDNDEDGLEEVPPLTPNMTDYQLDVSLINTTGQTATLAGWIDLNSNDSFEQSERMTVEVQNNTTAATLAWNNITPGAGEKAIRLRLFNGAVSNPQPLGGASGGEVEDYVLGAATSPPQTPIPPTLAPTGHSTAKPFIIASTMLGFGGAVLIVFAVKHYRRI